MQRTQLRKQSCEECLYYDSCEAHEAQYLSCEYFLGLKEDGFNADEDRAKFYSEWFEYIREYSDDNSLI